MNKETWRDLYFTSELALCLGTILISFLSPHVLFFALVFLVHLTITYFVRRKVSSEMLKTKLMYFVFRVVSIVICSSAVFSIALNLTSRIKNTNLVVPFYFSFVVGVLCAYVFFKDNKEKEDYAEHKSILFCAASGDSLENMDVQLCTDKETKQPVILKTFDRFLHMLIIGATGAGKTSQTLLPMILQDIRKSFRSIVVLEPKGDFAEKVYALAKIFRKKALYFNPRFPDCPSFNPLYGEEDAVVENMCKTFTALNKSNNNYFAVMAENLLRYGIMVIKRLEAANVNPKTGISSMPATLIRFNNLIHNSNGEGRKMVMQFKNITNISPLEKKQNSDIASWFLDDYFTPNSKVYENTSIVRAQLVKLTTNKYLRRVLNPENGISDIQFDKILEDDIVLAIGTEQGLLGELGAYLGKFIMLSYQAAVLRRPGDEETRKPNMFYCDEFQKYADIGFADILTQGRSYCVTAILATQSRKQIAMNMDRNEGESFLEIVSTNARNIVLFPGSSIEDVEYFSKKFGNKITQQRRVGTSRQRFDLLAGSYNPGMVTEQRTDITEAEFSIDDLEFQEFGTIAYQIVKDKTLQRARFGEIAWIPQDINKKMKKEVAKYKKQQERKAKHIYEGQELKEFREDLKNQENSYKQYDEKTQNEYANMSVNDAVMDEDVVD